MIETGVVIGLNKQEIHWHLPEGRSTVYLPDQHDLWEVLWANREVLRGFAHSHPGSGTPAPSDTDITTFQAVEAGLGRRLCWWITSADTLVAFHWADFGYRGFPIQKTAEPSWVRKLREHSGY